jgi:hypothetical protein
MFTSSREHLSTYFPLSVVLYNDCAMRKQLKELDLLTRQVFSERRASGRYAADVAFKDITRAELKELRRIAHARWVKAHLG